MWTTQIERIDFVLCEARAASHKYGYRLVGSLCGILSDMARIHPFAQPAADGHRNDIQQKIAEAIKLLLSALPRAEQSRLLREIADEIEPIEPNRGIYDAVVKTLPRRTEWTVDQLKKEIAANGIAADPKEIYNSLGYLTRKRRIRRVGYGRYLIDGGLLITADDLGVEPAPFEDD